jgi:hypothetical protein
MRGEAREGTFAVLREMPELWPLADEAIAELLDPDRAPAYVRAEILPALAVDPSPFAYEAVREAWLVDPAVFSTDVIVAMAERGAFEFEREVDVWFDAWDEGAEGDPFPVALRLAVLGDDRGAQFLRAETAEDDPKGEAYGRSLLAAAALARLGDLRTWDDVATLFIEETRSLVEEGLLDLARARVDALAFALALRDDEALDVPDDAPESQRRPRVGAVGFWLDVHHLRRDAEPRDGQALEQELDLFEAR